MIKFTLGMIVGGALGFLVTCLVAAIDLLLNMAHGAYIEAPVDEAVEAFRNLPSAEPLRCKDCKHNPKYEWFGCPMSHLSEAQRPETAWCWKGERKTDAETEV